jgi:general secretion pathway protein D
MALGVSTVLLSLTAAAHSDDGLSVKIYRCPAGQAQATADRLRIDFGAIGGVRIAVDERTSQVIVQAPPAIQASISQRFPASASATLPPVARQPERAQMPLPPRDIAIRNVKPEQIEASLWGMLGNRLSSLPVPRPQAKRYRLTLSGGGSVDLTIDFATAQVAVEGTGPAADACVRLIKDLDSLPDNSGGSNVRFVPMQSTQLAGVQRAAQAIQSATGMPAANVPGTTLVAQQSGAPAAGAPGAAPTPGPKPAAPAGSEQVGEKARSGLVNPVQIEMLPDIDGIVLRGNPQDVAQVEEIIKQIEQLSKESEPQIEILSLQYVDCVAMGNLVDNLYSQVYANRQGSVTITPVVKPNSLLIVGRPENVKKVIELVKRLDQPVDPNTQFQVFHLKFASATTVQATIQESFQGRGYGLEPMVIVTSDSRSNALIVRASPRDMAEVSELITRLDTTKSAAVNELRIIQLRHSMAQDVVNVMLQAIGTASGGVQAGGVGGQQGFGGNQMRQGGAGARPQQGQQRSAMLNFLTLDAQGQKLLSSGILSDVQITADARSNSVVVSAPSDSLELVEAVVRQLDELPAAEALIKVFTVVNGDASSLAATLQGLFTGQSQMTGGNQQPYGGAMMQTTMMGAGTSVVPLRFAIDSRTNSVIVSGSSNDLTVVEAVLTRLDEGVRNRRNEVFRLKNSVAQQVAATITTFLQSELQIELQGQTSAFEAIEREVVVVGEPQTNSIVLSATPRFFDEIKKIIMQLDERPPMVMIQVMIAQIDLGSTDEFGMELGLQDSVLFDRSILSNPILTSTTLPNGTTQQTIASAQSSPGFNFNNGSPLGTSSTSSGNPANVGGQSLTNFSVGRANPNLGYGGLVLSMASENVSFLLRALSENNRVEVLQRPHIMALDNQQAFVQVGQRVPYIQNANITAAGTQVQTNLIDVGLILKVQPRICPDGLVVMQIDAVKSSLEDPSTGIPVNVTSTGQVVRSPIIDNTEAFTTISAWSGQTVVLGGLIDKSTSEDHRKVPLLGDLPLLGRLFRYDSVVKKKTELLIIMTPTIVRNEAEADAIRRTEASRMNWCLRDVTAMFGEGGLRKRTDEWSDAETKVIYPDMKRQPNSTPGADNLPEPIPTPNGQPAPAPHLATPPNSSQLPDRMPLMPTPEASRPVAPSRSDSLPGDGAADARTRASQQQAQYPGARPSASANNVQAVVYQQPGQSQQQLTRSPADQSVVRLPVMGDAPNGQQSVSTGNAQPLYYQEPVASQQPLARDYTSQPAYR